MTYTIQSYTVNLTDEQEVALSQYKDYVYTNFDKTVDTNEKAIEYKVNSVIKAGIISSQEELNANIANFISNIEAGNLPVK